MKTKAELIMIIRLVRKYYNRKKVSSANLSQYGIENLGSLHQSIQMEQSQFNMETNRMDEHPESKTIYRKSRKRVKNYKSIS